MFNSNQPFFCVRHSKSEQCQYYSGHIATHNNINDIPIIKTETSTHVIDTISLIPFSQAKERGFEVHDNHEPIQTLTVTNTKTILLTDLLQTLPHTHVELTDLQFGTTEPEYKNIVQQIIDQEIGNGEGANFVIPRRFSAQCSGPTMESVCSIFRSLLENEHGAYWTFLFYDGTSYVVGASPERHISKVKNEVRMNPISGTFRKHELTDPIERKTALKAFLNNKKEIYELFMVTDEELKIMCRLCQKGGFIIGPYLKEMSQLIHTEYLLVGKSDASVHELIRQSMYAPTVTGSPVENAFRLIKKYEPESRGYYGATIAMIGRDENGQDYLDSPITIRTLEISETGKTVGRVGATLVKSSNPTDELKETHSKMAGVLNSIRLTGQKAVPFQSLIATMNTEETQIMLQKRNHQLSRFWIEDQQTSFHQHPELIGKNIVIIDAEDDFSSMLKTMIQKMGPTVTITKVTDFNLATCRADIYIPGPGPGNPLSTSNHKITQLRAIIETLYREKKPFFAECLSHQILSHLLGFPIEKKETPFQGTQETIDLFGKTEVVGFYNTFSAKKTHETPTIELSFDVTTTDIYALKGPHFFSTQFHPESILTPNGFQIIQDGLLHLLAT